MASAGRILIMPKGNYNAETEYEMLDLVFHNGKSWVAKKTVQGIEPSEAEMSADYWMKMCESIDLTEVHNRISAIENQMLSTLSLDDIDLSGYATKSELTNYATKTELTGYSTKTELNDIVSNLTRLDGRLDVLEPNVASLMTNFSNLSNLKIQTGNFRGTGSSEAHTMSFNFAPKLIFIVGDGSGVYSSTIIVIDNGVGKGSTTAYLGSEQVGELSVTTNGNDVTFEHTRTENLRTVFMCNGANSLYYWVAIG